MLYYNSGNDDCLQACIAGILELPMNSVYNVNILPDDQRDKWFLHIRNFMKLRHGVDVVSHEGDYKYEGLCIGIYQSIAGASSHAVVVDGIGGEYKQEHDPNPEHPIYDKLLAIITLTGDDNGTPDV